MKAKVWGPLLLLIVIGSVCGALTATYESLWWMVPNVISAIILIPIIVRNSLED